VPRYRLSGPARADIAAILRLSEVGFGLSARIRYRALLAAAMRRVAADPHGLSTVDRGELGAGIRSFALRHARDESRESPVGKPVHVLYFRAVKPGIVEIVRVLHERMEPTRHVDQKAGGGR
jgi:toxin ParE1/3/4